jgi:hypothetical protein
MRWRATLQRLSPRQILVLGFGCFLLWGFPGYMSTDSAIQLAEARAVRFSDGHPPFMAAEWLLLDKLVSGPLLMLVLQGLLFLGGLYFLLKRLVSERTAAWTAVAILLFPPVMTPMAAIWKDSQMAAYLVAGTAAVIQPRLRTRIFGLVLLTIACALRHNAVAAVVPLVFFLFEWKPGIRWWKRFAILFAAMVFTFGAAFAVTRVLAIEHVRLTPAFSDIVGVLAYTHDRTDEDLDHVLRGTTLAHHTDIQQRARRIVELRGQWRITLGDDWLFDYPQTPAHWAALNRAWKELVFDDPHAYLEYHWVLFARLLGLGEIPRAPVYNAFLEMEVAMSEVDHNASASFIQLWLGKAFYWLADHTPLFRPYFYVLIAFGLIALCCRDRLTLALFLSGFLYELSFFPVGVDPDYRYSHWMISAICIASVILFLQRRARGRDHRNDRDRRRSDQPERVAVLGGGRDDEQRGLEHEAGRE